MSPALSVQVDNAPATNWMRGLNFPTGPELLQRDQEDDVIVERPDIDALRPFPGPQSALHRPRPQSRFDGLADGPAGWELVLVRHQRIRGVAFKYVGDIGFDNRLNVGWPQRCGFAILHVRVVVIG